MIEKKTLTISWVNEAGSAGFNITPETILGRRLADLLKPGPDQGETELLERLKTGTLFQAYLVSEAELQQPGADQAMITGLRLAAQCITTKDHFLLLFKSTTPIMIKEMMNTTKDFILISDDRQRILEITPNLFLAPYLQRIPLYLKKVAVLIGAETVGHIQARRKKALDYITRHSGESTGEWRTLFSEDFRNLDQWIPDQHCGLWEKSPDRGFAFNSDREISYLYLKQEHALTDRDFTATVTVRMEKLCRLALILNQAQPTKWDPTGYSIGIRVHRGEPAVLLKKDTRFLAHQPAEMPGSGVFTFTAEKSGGIIRFLINNRPALEYADESPIPNTHACFGILAGGPLTLLGFEIAVREAPFDYAQTIQEPFRITLRQVPGRVYHMAFIPLTEWDNATGLPRIKRAMLFTDATDLDRIEQDRDQLNRKNIYLKAKNYYGFVGGNPRIQEIVDNVDNFADTTATVLINGPTGSGKEILARAIHLRSSRREKPFIKVDCASLPQTLLESELFGHEKGAFTGATGRVRGRFESAAGGTLFLDEIGNIDPAIQAKLLGFLEDHEVTPVGGARPVKVDTRVIAATNAPLEELIRKGLFRQDLYFRLKVIHVVLPPLKERPDDIPLLIETFLSEINTRNGTGVQGVSPRLLEALMAHDWPGNVRELYNVLLNLALQKKQGVLDQRPELRPANAAEPRAGAVVPERIRLEALLALARERPYVSARDCCAALPVSLHTIRKDLMKLVARKELEMEGRGPAVVYHINKERG